MFQRASDVRANHKVLALPQIPTTPIILNGWATLRITPAARRLVSGALGETQMRERCVLESSSYRFRIFWALFLRISTLDSRIALGLLQAPVIDSAVGDGAGSAKVTAQIVALFNSTGSTDQ